MISWRKEPYHKHTFTIPLSDLGGRFNVHPVVHIEGKDYNFIKFSHCKHNGINAWKLIVGKNTYIILNY